MSAPLTKGGEIVPGYRVLGIAHRSADVEVYDVWSDERHCQCVAKTVRTGREGEAGVVRRLLREGRWLARLGHPGLVRAYEVVRDPRPTVILEMLRGETLGLVIADGRLPLGEVGALGVQLSSTLEYLHGHGILHLDLKPANIVCHGGQATLIDLNIARAPGRAKAGVGTPAYMAPEQVSGARLTTATDVWGVGVVLYESLIGRRAFRDDDRGRGAPRVRASRRVPRLVGDAVDGCLELRPADRPSLAEVSDALGSVAQED